MSIATMGSPEDSTAKKRKRSKDTPAEDEIEIDLALPEPPSKKSKRQAKKKAIPKKAEDSNAAPSAVSVSTSKPHKKSDLKYLAPELAKAFFSSDAAQSASEPSVAQKKSEHGIWIGNLPYNATRESIRQFLEKEGNIDERDIVRLHLPLAPPEKGAPKRRDDDETGKKNKGFAYVDFTTQEICQAAIGLSERLIAGRRCLIKDAKSYEGRPVKAATENEKTDSAKTNAPAEKRVFVGNLAFETTREDLAEHFSRAGEVEDSFIATFEDTGKCKGFGWIRFSTLEAATAAVKGFIFVKPGDSGADGDEDSEPEIVTEKKSKPKRKKVFLNRLYGRELRCEFAQDSTTRYKKRFGKDAPDSRNPNKGPRGDRRYPHTDSTAAGAEAITEVNDNDTLEPLAQSAAAAREQRSKRKDKEKDQRRESRKKQHEAKTVAPVSGKKANGVAVAGTGKKINFDD